MLLHSKYILPISSHAKPTSKWNEEYSSMHLCNLAFAICMVVCSCRSRCACDSLVGIAPVACGEVVAWLGGCLVSFVTLSGETSDDPFPLLRRDGDTGGKPEPPLNDFVFCRIGELWGAFETVFVPLNMLHQFVQIEKL